MPIPLIAMVLFASLVAAVLLGQAASRRLAEHHLATDTRDTVKLSLGLVATMSALLLGLLVSSAKGTYDSQRDQIDELAAKVATLDRVLALYGPEGARPREELRATIGNAIARAWPQDGVGSSDLRADFRGGDAIYNTIQQLLPAGPIQSDLKNRAVNLTLELAEARALLVSRALTRVSTPLLSIIVTWLVLILFGFAVLAPRNAIATTALLAAATAVWGALLLLLEYYGAFEGLIQISSDPLRAALGETPN